MPNVLVASPYRVNTPDLFVQAAARHFQALTFPRRQLAMYPNRMIDGRARRYGPNAMARNELIDHCLLAEHTHVLWLDIDLVQVPPDLIEQLLGIAEHDIVAPFVFVEQIKAGPPSRENGGWFYDTGGFIGGRPPARARELAPHFDDYHGGTLEMESVGTCYLIPAQVYRNGAGYAPAGNEVEHVSLMRRARGMGYRVLATDAARVIHAYLPRYGVEWHG